ncbi:MAG: hypothetical protein PW734_00815 [Verrucomicrobium sp.]|nr:hypothetical protein [Verrucomicrobium sp.]
MQRRPFRLLSWAFLCLCAAVPLDAAEEVEKAKEDDAISNTLHGTLPPEVSTFPDVFAKGRFTLGARYKFERLSQDAGPNPPANGPVQHVGYASTLRLAVGYETAPVHGLTAYGEVAGVYGLGFDDDYRVTTLPDQNHAGYPFINDGRGTQMNQYWIDWKSPEAPAQLRFGQEETQLLNGRFVSSQLYRQTHQTLDLASIRLTPVTVADGQLSARYAYVYRAHRPNTDGATDNPLDMSTHVMEAAWTKKDRGTVAAYALLLDFNVSDYALAGFNPNTVQSTRTTGIRAEGPWKIDDDWGVHYVADFAHQADWGTNPHHVSENYWEAELGPVYKKHHFFIGGTGLGGKSATDLLSTPLSPPMNGWSEFFAANPALPARSAYGLTAAYVTATGPLPVEGLTYTVTGYDYWASNNGTHYGRELDAGMDYKFARHYFAGWRVGGYFADALYTDSVRTSVTVGLAF